MANGFVVQVAALLKRLKARPAPAAEPEVRPAAETFQAPPQPAPAAAPSQPVVIATPPATEPVTFKPSAPAPPPATVAAPMPPPLPPAPANAPAMEPPAPAPVETTVVGRQPAPLMVSQEDRNERILAGISENIRKSLQTRQAAQQAPVLYSEAKPRNNEYVRVKKNIITPHGHIRFSILKDWVSMNMLAVLRRASLDWKTPDDLIALVPSYLNPEAEVLDGQILLIGTPGHNEKLAIPIRTLDADCPLRDAFEYVSDARKAENAPAVVMAGDSDFEVVAKGVISQAPFVKISEEGSVQLLPERSPETLQRNYSAALQRMESTIGADAS